MIALDTHAALWALENSPKLSPLAVAAIKEAESRGEKPILASPTLYEIARALFGGRVASPHPVEWLLAGIENRFTVRAVNAKIAVLAAELPASFPSDPFDRIIAATAIAERVPLVTADLRIRNSGALRTLW